MDALEIGTKLVMSKLGSTNETQTKSVLSNLIGGGGQMDVAGLLGSLQGQGGGLAAIAQSWLGDGENQPVSSGQLRSALGAEKVAKAAADLGTDEASLLSSLQEAVPSMVDKGSSGGSLLSGLGGLGGDLGGLAGKLF